MHQRSFNFDFQLLQTNRQFLLQIPQQHQQRNFWMLPYDPKKLSLNFINGHLTKVVPRIHQHRRGVCLWNSSDKWRASPLVFINSFIGGRDLVLEAKTKYTLYPRSIYSWSIGHILEHEFFCLGCLGSQGSKEKKWIRGILSNFWGWFFQLLVVKKNLDFF